MVLFVSTHPLERAENLKAVYDAYQGEKKYARLSPYLTCEALKNSYDVIVTDEFLAEAHGKVIMINHACSGGKLFGIDQRYPYINKECCKLLDYVICTSEETRMLTAHQCMVDKAKVLPFGMPRTDKLFEPVSSDKSRRVYLFCPTYRTREEPPLMDIGYARIDELLHDDELLVVKHHPMTGSVGLKHYEHIIEISPELPTYPYLMSCDVLITDYSSILFDAHVIRKPVVLFAYLNDVQDFLATRGMYYSYPSGYSSNYAAYEDELVNIIRNAKRRLLDEDCRDRCCGACDGHSTERVIDLINSIVAGGKQ
nr:CDP-glycerol glycerophosphotransferase family protein [Clostridia bacterium]